MQKVSTTVDEARVQNQVRLWDKSKLGQIKQEVSNSVDEARVQNQVRSWDNS